MNSPISSKSFKKVFITDEMGNRKEITAHKIIIETGKTEFEIDPSEEDGFRILCLKADEFDQYFDLCLRPFAANGVHISADKFNVF
ncbi:hypothetical protein SAMN05880574_12533 [Chryseobacterium sp. RU37D]|uniref:hypothetical protein n=1 Tax=Chryseobacterium sp. RU37D TaxID=1907397 RepID=UPI0009547618|nr:hypothetical protein [Chryseobacterium sp. RU37D]SIQ78824.1 hypothetical protein SAMN05880574_12533 [Chryseobacterium sp. RU37D]